MAVTDIFPVSSSYPVTTKPVQRVLISEPDSAQEQRRLKWSFRRQVVTINCKALTDTELAALEAFHEARNGPYDVFSFLPPMNKGRLVTGLACGTGNGTETVFYLGNSQTPNFYYRIYTGAGNRNKVYKDGVLQGSGFTLANDDTNKRSTVTFTTPPANGVVITVDVDRYLIVRFKEDAYQSALVAFAIGEAELELYEVPRLSI